MTKNAAILDIMTQQDKVMLGYHTQKLLAETQHGKDRLNQLLQQINKPPENILDRIQYERIDRRLNIIPDESFQKVIEKLPPEHARILINERKHAEEKEKRTRDKANERNRPRGQDR
jgi:hypothetical protein